MLSREMELTQSYELDSPLVTPLTAYINVTKRCNARCQYCTDWTNDPDPKTDAPMSEVMRILSELKSLGIKEVVFSGGEPLLRRDIYDLLENARNLGLQIRIITNGSALTEDGVHRLAKLDMVKIGVSLDSLDTFRFTSIRGLKLRRVMQSIEILARLKAELYHELNISLYVTIHRLNIDDLLPITDFVKENHISVQFQPVHFAGTGIPTKIIENLWPSATEISHLAEIVDELISRKRSDYPIGSREEFLAQIPDFFRNKTFYPEKCFVAYVDIVIDQDLGLRPCWSMDPIAYLNDGKTSIRDVWYSETMQQTRKVIREKKCPGCLYSCHINKGHVPLPMINK